MAGRATGLAGSFIQGTYAGTQRAFTLDNTDLPLMTPLDLGSTELRVGGIDSGRRFKVNGPQRR